MVKMAGMHITKEEIFHLKTEKKIFWMNIRLKKKMSNNIDKNFETSAI